MLYEVRTYHPVFRATSWLPLAACWTNDIVGLNKFTGVYKGLNERARSREQTHEGRSEGREQP